MKLHRTLFTAWVFAAGVALHAQNAHNMVVQTNKLGAEIQPTMYGLFFEDINYGADGGLYAELVKNRSFEFPQRFMGWNVFGNVTLMDDGPFERNPHYVRLGNSGHREKRNMFQIHRSRTFKENTEMSLGFRSRRFQYHLILFPILRVHCQFF